MLLKACLNGARRPAEHPALPVSPAQIAAAAFVAVEAGAGAVHVHPKDDLGVDTLGAATVAAVVDALRQALPSTPIGVTTGAWAADGPDARAAAIRGWTVLPDFASVNWHEPGAAELATELLERGVGVEAGLWTPAAAEAWNRWASRDRCVRVLLEVVGDVPANDGLGAAGALVDALDPVDGVPVLLHGDGRSTWPVLENAVHRGLDIRIGLEDVLELPDGTPAPDNAALVAAAMTAMTSAREVGGR